MGSLKISLRAGERLFLNGAVLRVDRKTQVELLNDVTFLLESHVMQAAETKTPLRQLYFIIQMMLIEPARADETRRVLEATLSLLLAAFQTREIRDGLLDVRDLVADDNSFEALKRLRGLIPLEDAVLAGAPLPTQLGPVPLAIAAGARR